MPKTLPNAELELKQWLINFAQQCDNFQTALGLTPDQVIAISSAQGAFIDALTSVEGAKSTYKAAVADKDAAETSAIQTVQPFIARFQANPNLTPGLLATLGVVPRNPGRTHREVSLPTQLQASVNAVAGQVTLSWDPNGNPSYTQYRIEAAPSPAGPWSVVYVTERKRVTLTGYEAGNSVSFRVYASRAGKTNGPTNIITIYPQSAQQAA
jgi:hypothetical protein